MCLSRTILNHTCNLWPSETLTWNNMTSWLLYSPRMPSCSQSIHFSRPCNLKHRISQYVSTGASIFTMAISSNLAMKYILFPHWVCFIMWLILYFMTTENVCVWMRSCIFHVWSNKEVIKEILCDPVMPMKMKYI